MVSLAIEASINTVYFIDNHLLDNLNQILVVSDYLDRMIAVNYTMKVIKDTEQNSEHGTCNQIIYQKFDRNRHTGDVYKYVDGNYVKYIHNYDDVFPFIG